MSPDLEGQQQQFSGMYRAKIIAINDDLKSGVYKVRVWPMMEGIGEDFLPWATSTLTTRYRHIQLKVDDFVWVFFENSDVYYPVIFDLCNIKDKYPQAESGAYGTYDKMSFGDNGEFTAEYDESNKKLTIKVEGGAEFDIGTLLTIKTQSANLKTILTHILTALQDIITPGSFLGNMGVPIIPVPPVVTDLSTIITDLSVTLGQLLDD